MDALFILLKFKFKLNKITAYFMLYNITINKNGGISDIKRHIKTNKHLKLRLNIS